MWCNGGVGESQCHGPEWAAVDTMWDESTILDQLARRTHPPG